MLYKDQTRWNNLGKAELETIKISPEKFIIDSQNFSAEKLHLIKFISPVENKKILDLGSGCGELAVALAKLGGNITGIDIGDNLIELSRQVAKINNVKCEFVVGSITGLPFDNNFFDYIMGTGTLHHLLKEGIIQSLAEAYRVLKPGGSAIFIEPIENSKFFNFIQNLLPLPERPSILNRKKWKEYLSDADDCPISVKTLISAKGPFRNVQLKYYGLLIRLCRLFPNKKFGKLLSGIDIVLTNKYSPFKKFSQQIFAVFVK